MEILKHRFESTKEAPWGQGDKLLEGQECDQNTWYTYMENTRVKLTFSINRTITEKEDYKMSQTHEADTNRKAANVLVVKYGVLAVGA